MRIEAARYENGELILSVSPNARRFVYNFKPGEYEIAKVKKKRSLDANSYAWVLIDKISSAVNIPPLEVYRQAVADMGGTSVLMCVQEEAKEATKKYWTAGHIGRQVEEEPSKIKGCVNLRLTYGSSDYDVHEMSRFIDNLIQDCKALGIETRPKDEIDALLEEWNA